MPRETYYTKQKADRHSFVHFYMRNWMAGTAGLPRGAWSVLFQICMYSWDRAAPMPMATLRLMLADMPREDAEAIIDMLLDLEKIRFTDDGQAVYSEKALEEGMRSYAAWKAKSDGGKAARERGSARQPATGQKAAKKKDAPMIDGNIDRNNDTNIVPKTVPNSVPKTVPTERRKEKEERIDVKKGVSNDTPKKAETAKSPPDGTGDGDQEAIAAITAAVAKGEEIRAAERAKAAKRQDDMRQVVNAWNQMAVKCGLPQVAKMVGKRPEKLGQRIAEHGADTIIKAIATIPATPFLIGKGPRGWKAHIDWLVQPASCAKLVEGAYHSGEGEDGPWR